MLKLAHYFQSFLLFSYPETPVMCSKTPDAEENRQWTENNLLGRRMQHPGFGSAQILRQRNMEKKHSDLLSK